MDVWDVEDHPWLIEEKRAIRRWVRELDRPFLGQCLGHELLADAMAGTCGPQRPSEIGIPDVALTPEGTRDPVFAGLPREFKVLQWHSVKVAQPPDDAVVLASSGVCGCQPMRVGNRAWSMQYHVEIEPDTITEWGKVPAYAEALGARTALGSRQDGRGCCPVHAKLRGKRANALPQFYAADAALTDKSINDFVDRCLARR